MYLNNFLNILPGDDRVQSDWRQIVLEVVSPNCLCLWANVVFEELVDGTNNSAWFLLSRSTETHASWIC